MRHPRKRRDRQLPHKVRRVTITRTTAAVDTSHGVVGRKPHALFWVKTWCAKHRKVWMQAQLNTRVTIAHIQDGVDTNGQPIMVPDIVPLGEYELPLDQCADADTERETYTPQVSKHPRMIVVRVIGTADQLESLACWPCVERWEYVTTARVGYQAQGSGPEKMKPYVARAKALIPMSERTMPTEGVQSGWDQDTYPVQVRTSPTEEANVIAAHEAPYHTAKPTTSA